MALNVFNKFKEKESLIAKYFFIVSCAFLIIVLFCYFIILLKIYLQQNQINTLQGDASSYTTNQQKMYEKKFSEYKKKISDFSSVINDHRISSNIFTFLEEKTLPNVWFYNFDLSENTAELNLSGEAKSGEDFSKQVREFEKSSYIKSVSVLDSRISNSGGLLFILKISLDPKIFNYTSNPMILYE